MVTTRKMALKKYNRLKRTLLENTMLNFDLDAGLFGNIKDAEEITLTYRDRKIAIQDEESISEIGHVFYDESYALVVDVTKTSYRYFIVNKDSIYTRYELWLALKEQENEIEQPNEEILNLLQCLSDDIGKLLIQLETFFFIPSPMIIASISKEAELVHKLSEFPKASSFPFPTTVPMYEHCENSSEVTNKK